MKISTDEFNKLMQAIADGWNEGNAGKAADCFGEDAIYVEPPEKQLYHGRAELYEFFGGDNGTDIRMKMNRLVSANIHLKYTGVITVLWL